MKVYYNGSCNICNAEINHYKKTKNEISYVDISETKDEHVASLSKGGGNREEISRAGEITLVIF